MTERDPVRTSGWISSLGREEGGATEILVVDGSEPPGLLGIVTAGDMVRAYELGLERSVE